jgi:hypothetical protein
MPIRASSSAERPNPRQQVAQAELLTRGIGIRGEKPRIQRNAPSTSNSTSSNARKRGWIAGWELALQAFRPQTGAAL